MLPRHQRIRQIPEELLQQASNTVDIMEEVLRVSKVEIAGARVRIKQSLELVDGGYRTRKSIDAFNVQTKQIHRLDALIYHHRHGQAIPLVQSGETDTKHGTRWCHLRCNGRRVPMSLRRDDRMLLK